MKKILALLLAAVMLFSLAACSAEEAVDVLDYLLNEAELAMQETESTQPQRSDAVEPADVIVTDPAEPASTEPAEIDVSEAEPAPTDEEPAAVQTEPEEEASQEPALLDENGSYTSKDDVALYIHQYGHLPSNFITKKDAEALGWQGGSLEPYAPGKSIGGSRFGNYEGLLPKAQGRTYTECDIDTQGAKSRGAKRIVFSNDGLIYYTDDHYESFTLLYGEVD